MISFLASIFPVRYAMWIQINKSGFHVVGMSILAEILKGIFKYQLDIGHLIHLSTCKNAILYVFLYIHYAFLLI